MEVRLKSKQYLDLKNKIAEEEKLLAEWDKKAEEFKEEKGFESDLIRSSVIICLANLKELRNRLIQLLDQYEAELKEELSKLEDEITYYDKL